MNEAVDHGTASGNVIILHKIMVEVGMELLGRQELSKEIGIA